MLRGHSSNGGSAASCWCSPGLDDRRSTADISEWWSGSVLWCSRTWRRICIAWFCKHPWDLRPKPELLEASCDGVSDEGESESFAGLAVRWLESTYLYHALESKLDNELVVRHVDEGWRVGKSFAGLLLEGRFCKKLLK